MNKIKMIFLMTFISIFIACEKSFLDEKPDKSLLVPTTLDNFQSLLDNFNVMNLTTGLDQIATDDFYINPVFEESINELSPEERNSYLWAKDIYENNSVPDWDNLYQQIFYANVVLDGLEKLKPVSKDLERWENIKGSALFFRAMALYNLSQMFTAPYDRLTALKEPGIPIHLNSDVNVRPGRGTVQQTFDRVIDDLMKSLPLVPKQINYKTRPSRQAILALLARVYLVMDNYELAMYYSNEALKINQNLIVYHTVNANVLPPFPSTLPNGNEEVIFYNIKNSYSFYDMSIINMDPELYQSYSINDLRKSLFFYKDADENLIAFTGYEGLTIDELYLIRAECFARLGDFNSGIGDLNTLLKSRWKKDSFTSLVANNSDEALKLILSERRKELAGRDQRWSDLRRLNKDPRFAVTLKRDFNGKSYTLYPNDKRYTFPIPDIEILTAGIIQTPR